MLHQDINQAVSILRQGGLVGMPTETVYGLAADARNPEALRKIFLAKQRPSDHPLIVHIADIAQLPQWTSSISPLVLKLAKAFWPGPMTLILPKADGVSDLITGKQTTIGIRIPQHPVAQALLNAFGSGVAAPSANRFGHISPTTALAVREELGNAVDMVLDGGQCDVGVESTIIDVSRDEPVILRPGMISAADIETVLHSPLSKKQDHAPRVSGSLALHYAPTTSTQLIARENFYQLEDVTFSCVLLARQPVFLKNPYLDVVFMSDQAKQYAHDIYKTLRELDKKGYKKIFIETIPENAEWDAVRDRVGRATNI
jgi:L-threonylcarbamoyladenylate synthase